jgi:hypothetical protein
MEAVISKENTSWEIVKLSSVADIIAAQSPESKYHNSTFISV